MKLNTNCPKSYFLGLIVLQEKINVDFRYLLEMLEGSIMSSPDTIVVPAGKKVFAMQLILTPVILKLLNEK